MNRIDVLSSINGRQLINELFHKIRFERQQSGIATLFILWRICVSNSSANHYIKDIQILYKLGFIRGTIVWIEEVVNRFYFSTISSFVYFGAAIILILVGANKFSNLVDDSIVIYGMGFEATMLLFIFIIMLFSPNIDITNIDTNEDEDIEKELIYEMGEISKDFAVTSTQLDKISNYLLAIVDRQNELADTLKLIVNKFSDIQNPNPKVIKTMQDTNDELSKFNSQLTEFINATNKLKQEEISVAIRKELEKIISNRI
jgi:hypothetical protein